MGNVLTHPVFQRTGYSSEFREWLESANGSLYVTYLVKRFGRTRQEAEQWLWDIACDNQCPPSRITRSDFEKRIPRTKQVRDIKKHLSPAHKNFTVFDRVIGSMLHELATRLRMGLLPDRSPQQITIFELLNREKWRENVGPSGSTKFSHLQRIKDAADALLAIINFGGYQEIYLGKQPKTVPLSREQIVAFEDLLQPIVHPHLEVCKKHLLDDRSWYLYALALLTVSQLVLDQFLKGAKHFYIPGLPPLRNNVLHPGFVDVIEILTPDGHVPSRTVRQALLKAIQGSDADVAAVLEITFLEGLSVNIGEFKFMVGDGSKHGELILPWKNKPNARHLAQLKRYIALSLAGYAIRQGVPIRKVWETVTESSRRLIDGTLEYFVADAPSILFKVDTTLDLVDETIREEYVEKYLAAERNATIRQIDRAVGKALGKLSGKDAIPPFEPTEDKQPHLIAVEQPEQQLLYDVSEGLRDLIGSQLFMDRFHVIKHTMDDWEPVLHLDRLRLVVSQGKIATDPAFDWKRGGYLACIHPAHPPGDTSCSMHVDIPRLRVTCKSCRLDIPVDPQTVPHSVAPYVLPKPASRARNRHGFRAYEIDPRHFEFFAELQRLLQENLKKELGRKPDRYETPASWYLASGRGLSPRFAYERGCGFERYDEVTRQVIDTFGLEFATHFGVVTWTDRPNPKTSLTGFLKSRGYVERDLTHVAYEQTDRKEEDGSHEVALVTRHPAAALRGRITFPLELYEDHVANLYGRATFRYSDPALNKSLGHRKLSRAFTDAPQGGFRTGLFASHWKDGLVLTEAVLDALSLEIVLDGYRGIASLSGTHNPEVLEEISFCGSEILLAYDHDLAGREATTRAMELIHAHNPKARVRDLSAEFPGLFPETDLTQVVLKDWNKILTDRPGLRFRL